MLRTSLIHPQILEALGAAGHGSLVLIADGNFPSLTAPHREARRVYLNLRPGMVTVTDVLETLIGVVPVERATLMAPDGGGAPPIQADVIGLLEVGTAVDVVERHRFYAATRTDDLALVIVTGDDRWYANVLLTIGSLPATESAAADDRAVVASGRDAGAAGRVMGVRR
jgi:L-fucose mutarotase